MNPAKDPPIVAIAAPADRIDALQTFLDLVPSDTGAAYVIALSGDARPGEDIAKILRERTAMPVRTIEAPLALSPNGVYVVPTDRHLLMVEHGISALPTAEPRGPERPIDISFRSLAAHCDDGFAVALDGVGVDATAGLKAVKEAGGIVLVEDPADAEETAMSRTTLSALSADFVLPLPDLVSRLVELLATRGGALSQDGPDSDEDALRRILAHVRVRTGHDFSHYKRATILRRIARRAQLTRRETLHDYYGFLRDNAEEAQALFSDFLISVTTFFRDPAAFQSLTRSAVPALFEGKAAGGVIRVWVPGCATGEETYTIAMLLLEEAARREARPDIQVFGSDLDTAALAVAREGRYPAAIEADLTEERLRRFFQREGDHYRVRRELRDIVLFASHSLLRDPPFSRLDLISCRNLLIYLDRELQQQVCSTFHYALNPGGFLFLGSSESAEQPVGFFRPVDRDARIYRAAPSSVERRLTLPATPAPDLAGEGEDGMRGLSPRSGPVTDAELHRQGLEQLAPPSMLVDETHRAIHLSDTVGRYLEPSGGPVSIDAADMVRPELRFDLRAALHRAFERGEPTLTLPIPVQLSGASQQLILFVKPVPQGRNQPRHAIVMFIEGERPALDDSKTGGEPVGEQTEATIRRLQEELQLSESRLRATREESEAANEELRAANEELQSINEEYRSTSEELETRKEELQSINEELQTVNNELKLKLESVSRAHSDLQNLMAATDVGTLFLDPAMRIKRFTPRLAELFNVTPADEGRPITDFTHQLAYDALTEHARSVLRDLTPLEHEVQGRNGGWYLVRIRPYRTIDDKIDGVVATFVDITERRRAEEALRSSEERLRQEMRLVDLSRAPIFVWEIDKGILQWNRGSEQLYGYSREEVIGKRKELLLRTVVPGSSFEALRQELLTRGSWAGELQHRAKDGRILTVESQIELLSSGSRHLVLESTHDVTEQRRWGRRQALLMNELTHRVKNTLAVVQSLARQTLRTTTTREDFVERFEGRLAALAGAHSLLVNSRWEGADVADLVRTQLEAHARPDSARLSIAGEAVTLPPELATPFGLVLHELATNAAKYGGFSTEDGSVALDWRIAHGNDGARLVIEWRESGGPPVTPPERRGFGGELIERSLPGAKVTRRFDPEGLQCTIDLPLPDRGHEASLDATETG